MIRSVYRPREGRLRWNLDPSEFEGAFQDTDGLLWVDFFAEPADVCEPIFLETFGFHPLAVEDALQEIHVPKLDDWAQYLYVVLHAITFDKSGEGDVNTLELDMFLGENYIVSYHDRPIPAVERVWSACQRDRRLVTRGPDYLLYKLADELVAGYMPVVEEMDDAIELLEDQIFDGPEPDTLERLFTLKRALLQMRRIIVPQREVLNKLARDDYAVIEAPDRVFFRDVYDHLVRLHDINESMRDLVGGALDSYLSVINNRMNEIMKMLTIITTLFMPISFLTGFFGMNFFQPITPLGVWTDQPAFFVALGVMVLLPTGMFLWLRRRGWM